VQLDQSHHMTDRCVKGPDVKRLFANPGANGLESPRNGTARQRQNLTGMKALGR
jgi:hypothetical protein